MTVIGFDRAQRAFVFALCTTVAFAADLAPTQAAVVISSGATQNMSCSAGVCTPTAKKAVLNVGDLANLLAAGDVKVVSDSAAKDIQFSAPLSWTSTSRLTLDSYRSIVFQQPISVTGTGAVTITTNDGGSKGDFWFEKKGHIEFWDLHGDLIINGNRYKLLKSINEIAKAIARNPSGSYALSNTYDASKDGTYTQSPIPTTLVGTFEGLGNAISNFRLTNSEQSSEVALFAGVDVGSVLRDLNMTKETVVAISYARSVGGLVAMINGGTISQVDVSAHISADLADQSGILAGASFGGVIQYSATAGSISGNNNTGGLVGNEWAKVIGSHSSATISSAFADAGGLIGVNNGPISLSYATGSVTIGGGSAGGLVGYNSNTGTVDSSFATGTVQAGDEASVGGLVGYHNGGINNGYATGTVTGGWKADAGGLVGYKIAALEYSYSTGPVAAGPDALVGGLLGLDATLNGYNNTDDYWDMDTSRINDPGHGAGNVENDGGITGLTDAQFKSGLPDGFNPKIWGQKPGINNGYPYLLANPPPK